MSNDRVIIFDTTLRDGEQSPGASMTKDEKLRIAKGLERLGVDVIEAGFAIASVGDFESVKNIADNIQDSTICSLARAMDADIDRAAEALAGANSGRIHTFIATSPIHMEHKLRLEPNAVVEHAVRAVKRARSQCADVEFSCEDASRSDIEFLCRIVEAAIDAGASTINLPDTVGYAVPEEYAALIREIRERVPNSDKAIFSVHCHNDLGLAVANSLAAVAAGARQVECTINGLGERAGNAALEEIVMAIKTREDALGVHTRINTPHILSTSRMVSSITGFPVQPNKAIVGANAFAHESGIHQDGVLKHRETYEIMTAQDVGWNTNRMVLGKHSGRNAFRSRLEELGIGITDEEQLRDAFVRFKELADKKHEVFDEDLQALVSDSYAKTADEYYQLVSLEVTSRTGETPVAQLVITAGGETHELESEGSGPVDATFNAIESLAKSGANLQLFSVNAITQGADSQGDVTVRLEYGGRVINGNGTDTDIVMASARAYLNALNTLRDNEVKAHPQA